MSSFKFKEKKKEKMMPYKIPLKKDKFQTLFYDERPISYSPDFEPSPTNREKLTNEQEKELRYSIGLLFSEGNELIQDSIATIINLMNINFSGTLNELQTKKNIIERFIKLIKNPLFLNPILELLSILLEKSSKFDDDLIQNEIDIILTQILYDIASKTDFDDECTFTLWKIFSVSKNLARSYVFVHKLFENHFYDQLPLIFSNNYTYNNEESVNESITSLLYKTTISIKNNGIPNETNFIFNMIPLLLNSSNSSIIWCGCNILSKLSQQTCEVQTMLQDGKIIQNLCSFISRDEDINFVIEIISNLKNFASLGGDIIDLMNYSNCLQNISTIFDIQNQKLVDCVFDLILWWLTNPNNSLENMYNFLKIINFIYIFENTDYETKNKALRILTKSAFVFSFNNQLLELINFDLFKTIIYHFSLSDDSKFSDNGCCLIQAMISNLSNPRFLNQIKSCFLNVDFYNRLDYIRLNEEKYIADRASEIIAFIQKISTL